MLRAVEAARDAARGSAAVCVSHQLPIWTLRLHLEGRRYAHDPRRRQCGLASVTSVTYEGERVAGVSYAEPAGATDPDAVPGA
jgi:broad specificity phosphatase PhoE